MKEASKAPMVEVHDLDMTDAESVTGGHCRRSERKRQSRKERDAGGVAVASPVSVATSSSPSPTPSAQVSVFGTRG